MSIRPARCAWPSETIPARLYSPSRLASRCHAAAARARDWTLMVQPTDRPATEALLPCESSSMPIRASIRMQNEGRPLMSGIRSLSLFPSSSPHSLACRFCISAAHHAPTPSTCAVSAAATHSGLRPRMRPRRTRPGGCCFLRLSIAACLILAMRDRFEPLALDADGALAHLLDNGWPAAPGWERRIAAAARRIETAKQKFAARSHRRDVRGRPRHRAHRGARRRSLAGTQTYHSSLTVYRF